MSNNHDITLEQAQILTANFRQKNPGVVRGGKFDRDAFDEILAQSDCVGIRYYYGLDANDSPQLILVGVNSKGNDMIDDLLCEMSWPCPPTCGDPNVLNGY